MKKVLILSALVSFVIAASANAYDRGWHRAHWGEGHWMHDRHNGQLGWWWVIGGAWYFYPHPVAQPTTVIVEQAPPPQVMMQQPLPPPPMMAPPAPVNPVMYYCKATATYYPETMTCPNGWSTVTSGQPPAP